MAATKYKDSGIPWIGMIPSDWNVVRTKNVFACSKSLVGEDWSHTQLLSLTTKGIKEVAIGSTSGKVPDSYETYQVVNKDDLVMCLFDLDCSAVFSGVSNFHGMISPAYKVLKTLDGYSPAFYGYWFDYIFDGRKYKYLSKNIRYSLTYDEFAALGIAAPPLPTQQRIADFLDRKCAEIDELAALQETMIAELKRYKQSVITEAVTKGLDPNVPMKDSGVEWIGEIPEGWEKCKLKRAFTLLNGRAYSDTELLEYGKYRILRVGNLFTSDKWYYSDLELDCEKYCELNDLLYGWSASIGPYIWKGEKVIYHYHIWKVLFKPNDLQFSYYVLQALTDAKRKDMHGSAMQHLTKANMDESVIPLPPLTEQRAIADYLDKKCAEIDELIAIKQQKIEALKEYKKSVIFEYVTGKKEVEC